MSGSRLSTAVAEGMFAFPDGVVAVWGARPGSDVADLPADAKLISTFRQHYDAFASLGWSVDTAPPADAALAVVFVPREKALARAMLAEAARVSRGPVVIDGTKTDGVESLLRALKGKGELSQALSKAHGKLAVLGAGADLSDWNDPGPVPTEDRFMTVAGVFSADGPDPASRTLAEALPARLGPRVADLGAGWGYLSRAVLERADVAELHLVEADLRALDCARLNIGDPRAEFHWADATQFADDAGFDTIVTNPPFHDGRASDPDIGRSFIAAAARLLRPRGQLWLVANRHLPYEKALGTAFGEVAEVGGTRAFKLYRAARPRREGALA